MPLGRTTTFEAGLVGRLDFGSPAAPPVILGVVGALLIGTAEIIHIASRLEKFLFKPSTRYTNFMKTDYLLIQY